jgi:7-cyano-7-deazaguanine synthase
MEKTLVLISGGLDSSVLAHWLIKKGHHIEGLFLDIGQSGSAQERPAAEAAAAYGGGFSLHSASIVDWRKNVPARFNMLHVPRNALLVLLALPYALALECASVVTGSNADDRETPDSNDAFYRQLDSLARATQNKVNVKVPFLEMNWSKHEIVEWAISNLGREFIGLTFSCWWPDNGKPCGTCAACQKRSEILQAF